MSTTTTAPRVCAIRNVAIPDETIRAKIMSEYVTTLASGSRCYLTISGYTYDHRELWEIPEAVDFLTRWIRHGGMSCLTLDKIEDRLGPGMDALEVWLIVKGVCSTTEFLLSDGMIEEFWGDLQESNRLLDSLFEAEASENKEGLS